MLLSYPLTDKMPQIPHLLQVPQKKSEHGRFNAGKIPSSGQDPIWRHHLPGFCVIVRAGPMLRPLRHLSGQTEKRTPDFCD
jgi:hypothetical protein